MKINSSVRKDIEFRKVCLGEVFYSPIRDMYYMRTEKHGDKNSVNLKYGYVTYFDDNEKVVKCNAELNVMEG